MSSKHADGQGGSITILEHGSAASAMRFRMTLPKGGGPPAPECHPTQTEDFRVVRGTLDLGLVAGRRVVLNAGDTFHLAAGVYHHPANGGDGELEFEAVLSPGLESANMFTDLYAVLRGHRGLGQFARVAIVFRRYTNTIHFKVPVRTVMTLVAAVARLFGVRALPAGSAATPSATSLAR